MELEALIKKYERKPVTEVPGATTGPEPLVTVIVYTFNHRPFIAQCLDSLLAQRTAFPYEIYLGDDDSTDGTREICLDYARRYPGIIRLFLHHRENKISLHGRVTGRFNLLVSLRAARGKYIAFCEGDDCWTATDKLQEQASFLEDHPGHSLCFTNIDRIDAAGNVLQPALLRYEKETYDPAAFAGRYTPPTVSVMLRKSSLPAGFPESMATVFNADTFLFTLAGAAGHTRYFPRVTASYRIHGEGVHTRMNLLDKAVRRAATYRALLAWCKDHAVRRNLAASLSRNEAVILHQQLALRRYGQFFSACGRALADGFRYREPTLLRAIWFSLRQGRRR